MIQHEGFFSNTLEQADQELFNTIKNETERQSDQIELIASENIVSQAVLEAQNEAIEAERQELERRLREINDQ